MTRPNVILSIAVMAAILLPLQAEAQSTGDAATTPTTAAAPQPSRTNATGDISDVRIISDPLYLPMKGQVYGMTGYTFDRPTGQNFKNGSQTSAFTADDHSFDQTLAYGITNRLTVRLGFGYGVNERDSTAAATGDVTVGNSRGFNDPTFSATYRVIDEPGSPLVFDVTGSVSPDFMTAKASGGVGEGTLARGGQNAGIGVEFGRVTHAFTLAGTVSATYVGQQTTFQLSNDTSTSADAHWAYALGVASQTRFTDRVTCDAGLTVGSAATYTVTNVDTTNSHVASPAVTRALNFAFNYHLVPNRVVVAATYSYSNNSDATNTFAKATSDTAVKDRSGNAVGVRLFYTFR
jgi:hypothetical protein